MDREFVNGAERSSKTNKMIVVGSVVLLLILIGIGIYFLVKKFKSNVDDEDTDAPDKSTASQPPPIVQQTPPRPETLNQTSDQIAKNDALKCGTGGLWNDANLPLDSEFTCLCPSDAYIDYLDTSTQSLKIYGANPYTFASDVCTAAVHAGVYRPGIAGFVTFKTKSYPPSFDMKTMFPRDIRDGRVSQPAGDATTLGRGMYTFTSAGAKTYNPTTYIQSIIAKYNLNDLIPQVPSMLLYVQTTAELLKTEIDKMRATLVKLRAVDPAFTTIMSTRVCKNFPSQCMTDFDSQLDSLNSQIDTIVSQARAVDLSPLSVPLTEIEATTRAADVATAIKKLSTTLGGPSIFSKIYELKDYLAAAIVDFNNRKAHVQNDSWSTYVSCNDSQLVKKTSLNQAINNVCEPDGANAAQPGRACYSKQLNLSATCDGTKINEYKTFA